MTGPACYLRYPNLRDDQVVFTADDDVWLVARAGGTAMRLTSDRVAVSRPRLSPDGAHVAWLSRRDGQPEVYVMPLAGGVATRLTHWGTRSTKLLGWTADGRVVAASPVGQPHATYTWAYALPIDATPGERLPYGPIGGLAERGDGAVAVQSVVFREPAAWKRYRGGTAPKIWVDSEGSGQFTRFLPELDGQLHEPHWIGDRLLFVSDHEGYANVYSATAGGADLRRHTDHAAGMYARNLSGDGQRAVYQRAGELWLIDSLEAGAEPSALPITLPGARSARLPVTHDIGHAVDTVSVDATGRASAVGVRGTVQWLTHLDGPVRALADTPGVRTRLPSVAAAAPVVAWVTDADGDDALEIASSAARDAPPRRILGGRLGRVLELVLSPDGAWAAAASHDGRVLVIDLETGSAREVERNDRGDATGLAFSPDSGWLAWSAPQAHPLRSIHLAAVAGGDVIDATGVRFLDTEPAFTLDGKFLAFLSARTFDPVYDTHNFELSFPVGVRPYLLSLAARTPSPFDPELSGRPLAGSEPPAGGSHPVGGSVNPSGVDPGGLDPGGLDPSGAGHAAAPAATAVRVQVDADRLAERIAAVPVAAGLYDDLRAVKDGLLWLERAIGGEIGDDRPIGSKRSRATLRRWDFVKRTDTSIVDQIDGYAVSGDGSRIVVRDGAELRVGPADHRVDDPAPGEVVTVDLGRVTVVSDPGVEWGQMLDETWRLMRDHFWVEDMGGVDWDGVRVRYRPMIERLATRDDLSEVLWEMIAELGSSHAYERPPVADTPHGRAAAFLGADLSARDDGRWRVDVVLPSEPSVPRARSPLAAAGADVRPGDVLLAVNGRPIPTAGVGPLLAGLADKPVELTVERDGDARAVVVVPVPDETPLRYQAWVADRRRHVHERSGGRVGYVHVPDMMSTGWAEFNRDLRTEVAREALVVDTRENGGGHTSELVIERLSRHVLGWDSGRYAGASTYPTDAPRGPLVSIANEMAGSDGDIVNQAFKLLGLGPIVGTRTWGGVIGIDGRYDLVDGTTVTQPRYAFWFADVGWGVENHGVDPDIDVPCPPQSWVAGDDPQLDRGIAVVLDALATYEPVRRAELSTRPSRRPPDELPPRPTGRS